MENWRLTAPNTAQTDKSQMLRTSFVLEMLVALAGK